MLQVYTSFESRFDYEALLQKSVELFKTGFNGDALREAFNVAIIDFTDEDWINTASVTFTLEEASPPKKGITYLNLAAQHGWEDVVSILIDYGSPVLHSMTLGEKTVTCIDTAVQDKHYTIVKLLIEAASKEENWNEDDDHYIDIAYMMPPEIFVALSAHINVYKAPRLAHDPDWLPIAQMHRHDIFCHLLKNNLIEHALLESRGLNYLTFLLYLPQTFSENEIIEALPLLLDTGLDLNYETKDKFSALCVAIFNYQYDLAKQIVESGKINITLSDRTNFKVFSLLMDRKNYEFLDYLICKGFMSERVVQEKMGIISTRVWERYKDSDNCPQLYKLFINTLPHVHNALKRNNPSIKTPQFGYVNDPLIYLVDLNEMAHISYTHLFDEKLQIHEVKNKVSALKYALSICHSIMLKPKLAVTLLGDFENRLKSKWDLLHGENSIHRLLGFEFSLKEHVGLQWPIPLDHVTHSSLFSKQGFLERECFAFFSERGFNTKGAVKLFDAVFDGTFEKLISNVTPFTENRINPHMLLHGKNIHNISRIIIISAFERGLIPTQYFSDGKEFHITIPELFSAMVSPEFSSPTNKHIPWSSIFDARINTFDTFSDPYQMHSHLMTQCTLSTPYLKECLKQSFAKGLLRQTQFVNHLMKSNWTTSQVWERYVTPRIPNLFASDTRHVLSWLKETKKYPLDKDFSETHPVQPHRLARL